MELKPNLGNLLVRCLMLIMAIFLETIFFLHRPKHANRIVVAFIKVIHLHYFLLALFPLLFLLILVSMLEITSIEVEEFSDLITFKKFTSERTIEISDIESYSITIKKNSLRTFYGLLLTISKNDIIQLAPQNIESLDDFKAYLIEKGIPFLKKTRPKFPFR